MKVVDDEQHRAGGGIDGAAAGCGESGEADLFGVGEREKFGQRGEMRREHFAQLLRELYDAAVQWVERQP